MSTLSYDVTLEDCEVEYTCISRGRPATGPTYDCGGQPAESPEFDITVRYNGQDITLILDEDVLDDIRDRVEEDYNEEPDPYDPDDDDS